jgi:FMN phosphatase YigB (HAD superfamily)
MAAPEFICYDLDDTLHPNSCKYNEPIWQCGLIISRALGYRSMYPVEALKLHYEIDSSMVKEFGFKVTRFPESWVKAYETIAEKAGVPARKDVAEKLRRTAARFAQGPFRPFPGTKAALRRVRKKFPKAKQYLVTAGDDELQWRKIRELGFVSLFDGIEVTGVEKKQVLRAIVGDRAEAGVMVGDSKKSDIVPALELGMTAIWVPSQTWNFANAEVEPSHTIASIRDLPGLLERLATK